MVMDGDREGVRPPKGVYCNVQWVRGPITKAEKEKFGDVIVEVSVKVFVAPEHKLPKGKIDSLDWTAKEEVHPFWFIKRGKPHEDAPNMELVYNSVSHIMASPLKALVKAKAKVKPQTDTFTVEYPCLVNTAVIEAGQEVILKWDQKKEEKASHDQKEKRPLTSW